MIEKLKVVIKPEDWNLPVNELEMRCLKNLLLKVDELVEFCNDIGNARSFLERHEEQITKLNDAVNNQQIQLNNHECRLLDLQNQINEHDQEIDDCAATISKMEKVETRAENVQDKFAEQRRRIGKLCRFRDKDYKDDQWDYGLLQAVANAETAHIWKAGCFKHNLGHWYDFCEPVKPDDDIIYKGGDNE